MARELSEELLAARRAIDGIPEVSLLEDLQWDEGVQRWVLKIGIDLGADVTEVEARTEWYVLIHPTYPRGSITIHPARTGGLTDVREHQAALGSATPSQRWTTADICVRVKSWLGYRGAFESEPRDHHLRLSWYAERAIEWLKAAATNTLAVAGGYFELPQVIAPPLGDAVAFVEDEATFGVWQTRHDMVGLARLRRPKQVPRRLVVYAVKDRAGNEILSPRWGRQVREGSETESAIWIRISNVPVAGHWRVPSTWGELRTACAKLGCDLDTEMQTVLARIRDGRPHVMMLGFPIPRIVGELPVRMHWWCIRLPVLSRGRERADGFRADDEGHWQRDRQELLANNVALRWLATENWDREEVSARGRLSESLRGQRILIIGVGSLGSAIAELLVRGGVRELVLLDPDLLEAGNLVRHLGLLTDLDTPKAAVMAERLNSASPHADVIGIWAAFPPLDVDATLAVELTDVVIDVTASDDLLDELEAYPWPAQSRTFCSVSLGMDARRLFFFAHTSAVFDRESFLKEFEPWRSRELDDNKDRSPIYEPIGCYHPLFPARVDRVWRQAARAVEHLDQVVGSGAGSVPSLTVFDDEGDG